MATHCNFAVIQPDSSIGPPYRVLIVRGVKDTGDPRVVEFDVIASNLGLEQAVQVACAAPFIEALDFYAYAENTRAEGEEKR